MKLKEIKHCMAICCTNIEQVRELDKKMKSGKCFEDFLPFPCYILTDGKKYYGCVQDKNFISSKNYNPVPQIVNFSDLIIPEMSAEDALLAYDQMCRENYCCNDCPVYGIVGDECTHKMDGHISEIMDAIKQWKAEHEKKEPEIETVDICRIIEILPDGRKRCVHEEDIKSELPFGGDERQKVDEILKRYCMEHDGEYIAVHEVVSRVKVVE